MIGGLLAGLEHAFTGRPKTPAQVEEQYKEPWASANGLTVEGLEDPIERPEAAARPLRRQTLIGHDKAPDGAGALSVARDVISGDHWFQRLPETWSIQSMTSCRSSR